jgi:flagellin
MKVNTNMISMVSVDASTTHSLNLNSSLNKLSSGIGVGKASDDPAGLNIADKLKTQKNGIKQSLLNASSAMSLIQIADKAMAEQSNILDIVKQKLIQASTATTSSEGRKAIAGDIDKLLEQLNNIASQTNYNGISLLQKGSADTNPSDQLLFQIGVQENDVISNTGSIQSNTAGLSTLSVLKAITALGDITASQANSNMATMDNALNELNAFRSNFGSTQIQVESSMRNLIVSKTNIAAAESIIRDVNFADESANFNKTNLMNQANTYVQSQANALPQSVLQLLN